MPIEGLSDSANTLFSTETGSIDSESKCNLHAIAPMILFTRLERWRNGIGRKAVTISEEEL
jgi:hypothetical protein